jgi:hypothetical protein
VLRKVIDDNQLDWDVRLPVVVWAFRIAYKVTTRHTPFRLMFGVEARMLSEWELPSLQTAVRYDVNQNMMLTQRLHELLGMMETREEATDRLEHLQHQRKKRTDDDRRLHNFKVGELVLWCKKRS